MGEAIFCTATGKRRLTRKDAAKQARWWHQVRFARMRTYKCKKCGSWHIGNDRARRPRRVA